MYLTGRIITPERMDDPSVPREELARSLTFLRKLNRRLGGTGPALRQLARWTDDRRDGPPVRVLDLGTGSADIPLAMVRWGERHGVPVHVTAVDAHETTLAIAREAVGTRTDVELVRADVLELDERFEPGSFDYAHASLFLHHLTDVQVLTTLRLMDRLATRGLMWNDLVRGWFGRMAVRVGTLGAPEIVRFDGRVSVDAGFTRSEVMDLARRVELDQVAYRPVWGYRFVLVSTKTP